MISAGYVRARVVCFTFVRVRDDFGREMRCLLEIFECLEPTRAFSDEYVCHCWIIWRCTMLGAEHLRAGAMAFRGGGTGGGSDVGWAGL